VVGGEIWSFRSGRDMELSRYLRPFARREREGRERGKGGREREREGREPGTRAAKALGVPWKSSFVSANTYYIDHILLYAYIYIHIYIYIYLYNICMYMYMCCI
jgi:hypothetical protein